MPTYETTHRFERDFHDLTPAQQTAFRAAIKKFVEDLEKGKGFRKGLRVKGVQGTNGVFELTWADDGRATFMYGDAQRAGQIHIIWRRCGTHRVFGNP